MPHENDPRADLLAVIRAGVRAAVASSDYVDLPPELVSQRAWNQARQASSATFGAPAQAHELLRQCNLWAEERCGWHELVTEALQAGGD